jgi:hypothetical protein
MPAQIGHLLVRHLKLHSLHVHKDSSEADGDVNWRPA